MSRGLSAILTYRTQQTGKLAIQVEIMDFVELLSDGFPDGLRESLIIPTAGISEIPFRMIALKIFHVSFLQEASFRFRGVWLTGIIVYQLNERAILHLPTGIYENAYCPIGRHRLS
jgi:hypothetical protein